MPDNVITVSGHEYLIGRLNAFQQFDIARRVSLMSLVLSNEVTPDHEPGARFITGMLDGLLRDIPQADMDFVRHTCLRAVGRIPPGGQGKPAPIVEARNGNLMFEDISMPDMLELMDAVLQENLSPFLQSLRGKDQTSPSPDVEGQAP